MRAEAYQGAWEGELLDVHGEVCWRVSITLSFTGERGAGQGLLRSTFFPEQPPVPVTAEASLRDGGLRLLLVAPERFDEGVCWLHQLALVDGADPRTLAGEGDYYEAPEPYEDDEPGELGALRLRSVDA